MKKNYNKNNNHSNYTNRNHYHRKCNTGAIINALSQLRKDRILSAYTINDMIEYVLKNPFMKNCSHTIYSLKKAYYCVSISSYTLEEHIWRVLRNA